MVKMDDGGLLNLVSHSILALMGGKKDCDVKLRDDESFQDKVNFIKKFCGPEVEVSCDFPSIHQSLGLRIGNNEMLSKLHVGMKAGIAAAVQAMKEYQAKNNNYSSWKALQGVFDGDMAEMSPLCRGEPESR